ncbi:NUDIX hydrolase [Herbidospora sp. RD11066]
MAETRPAARVVCLDGDGRVLLLRWHDHVSDEVFWEPPGGGIDPGESPLAAARRELTEETGLPGEAVEDLWVSVERDFHWLGVHYVKTEPFFLARFEGTPQVASVDFTSEETGTYRGHAWHTPDSLDSLEERVEPPNLRDVIERLL